MCVSVFTQFRPCAWHSNTSNLFTASGHSTLHQGVSYAINISLLMILTKILITFLKTRLIANQNSTSVQQKSQREWLCGWYLCCACVYDVFRGVMSALLAPACAHGSYVCQSRWWSHRMSSPIPVWLRIERISLSGCKQMDQSFTDSQQPSMCTYKMFGSSSSSCQV